MTLSTMTLCHYAECHCAECHNLFIVMLNVIMPCQYAECHYAEYRENRAKLVCFKEQKKMVCLLKPANLARFLTKYKHGFRVEPHKGR
jgi:hypothetical protein